jgi:PIN domain nuclease of toxin-antitoxin system
MAFLLDTNVALRALARPSELRSPVRRAIERGPNVLSAVVYWEVMLKAMKGLLDVGDPLSWWPDAVDQLSARPLPLRPEHVAALHSLPAIHRDPFDRMLIAQAAAEGLTLLTSDRDVARYRSSGIRVL